MRLVSVILDINTQSLDSAYTYGVPEHLDGASVGCAVLVEFGRRRAVGFVMSVFEEDIDEQKAAKLKPVLSVLSESYFDEDAARLIEYIAESCIAPLSSCVHLFTPVGRSPKVVKRGDEWVLKLPAKRRTKAAAAQNGSCGCEVAGKSDAFAPRVSASQHLELTEGQTRALAAIESARASNSGEVVLVDGVTGSGKTEVYLRAIESCLSEGKGAIVLVPEISLTPQTVARFKSRFGDTVAVMHSAIKDTERFDQWHSIRSGECRVVVGARSALFAPVYDLGLIIIDEEHESTYKQESAPRYHARDVAAWMARQRGALLVLGSATPSIETLYHCNKLETWHRVVLPERANRNPMPAITVVDMAREFGSGSRSMFSEQLADALFGAVDAGRKAVLMLNQRGFANFVLCRQCGFVPECQTCSVSLTFHEDVGALICHHCGRRIALPPVCPQCSSPYLKKFGAGTQRVEAELARLLEGRDVRIIRMDSDTTSTRGEHARLLGLFGQPGAAVLLGTQMIAKGLDFEDVTLVGVINADTQLHLPDFRSSERTFDLIEQVAGRAGRAELPGQVLVQTYMAESVAIQAAAAYDRTRFLKDELPKRKLLGYPPYVQLANILVWGADEGDVRAAAMELAGQVDTALRDFGGRDWVSFGAAPCAISRLRGNFRWHILIKAPLGSDVPSVISPLIRKRKASKTVNVACDINPFSLL